VDYVDRHATGWTEVRVHGVAGTAPEAILEHPHVVRVAGNAQAGFFRRLWEARSTSADTALHRTEAYSWGGLTSGDNTRALWLLLLPFMLLNVAFFMAPYRRPPEPGGETAEPVDAAETARRRWARMIDRFSASVQRLLALSFTATFALTTVTVAMDLVGWQCAATRDVCGTSWLGWLAWDGLDRPGRQLAVTALLPLAVITFLWWLARTTWQGLERVDVPQSAQVDVATPLEDRAMWNGRAAVRRLRALHVATGLAVPAVFVLVPLRPAPAPLALARVGDLALLVALLVVTMVLALLPGTGSRERPRPAAAAVPAGSPEPTAEQVRDEQERAERSGFYRWWPWVATGLTSVALLVACLAPEAVPRGGTLPWLVGTTQWLFAGQALLLVVLVVVCRVLRRQADAPAEAACGPGARRVSAVPAWHGLALPGVAMLAWVLAGGFSAGVILRAAQFLGTPVATDTGTGRGVAHPLVVPTAYTWAAVAGLVLGVVAAGAAGVVWWRLRAPSTETTAAVETAYGPAAEDNPERRDEIAGAWYAATSLTRCVQGAVGFLLAVTVLVLVAGGVGFLTVGSGLLAGVPWLVDLADLAITGFVLGLVAVGRQAYRNPALRRSVGIAWDLGTFWPRAVHPLAPPCYAERAIPDLLQRLQYYTGPNRGNVLLSCHSQGTVIGAAVLLQVETAVTARTAFLSYGCPLTRLYAAFFPAYVNATALGRLGSFLSAAPGTPSAHERASWRWRNLYRPSDPIGGPVFCRRELVYPDDTRPGHDPGDIDRPLLDPVFARPAGDPCYPPILGHSNYFADPAFAWTAEALCDGVLPQGTRAGDRAPVG
jgi:hypothetical protein